MSGGRSGVTVVIPIMPWALSKSRLDVPDAAREDLARAFALDVIDVVSASASVGQVVLVSAERDLNRVATRVGAVLLLDRPLLRTGALDLAVDSGRRWAAMRRPRLPVVVVPGDLPAMTTAVFDHAVGRLCWYDRAFVPDGSGLGTTLTWASAPQYLHTCYGPSSASRHVEAGFHPVVDVDRRARWDVDTGADLVEARLLGVGPHTSAAVGDIMANIAAVRH